MSLRTAVKKHKITLIIFIFLITISIIFSFFRDNQTIDYNKPYSDNIKKEVNIKKSNLQRIRQVDFSGYYAIFLPIKKVQGIDVVVNSTDNTLSTFDVKDNELEIKDTLILGDALEGYILIDGVMLQKDLYLLAGLLDNEEHKESRVYKIPDFKVENLSSDNEIEIEQIYESKGNENGLFQSIYTIPEDIGDEYYYNFQEFPNAGKDITGHKDVIGVNDYEVKTNSLEDFNNTLTSLTLGGDTGAGDLRFPKYSVVNGVIIINKEEEDVNDSNNFLEKSITVLTEGGFKEYEVKYEIDYNNEIFYGINTLYHNNDTLITGMFPKNSEPNEVLLIMNNGEENTETGKFTKEDILGFLPYDGKDYMLLKDHDTVKLLEINNDS